MRKILSLVSLVMLFVGGLNAQAPTEEKTIDPNAPIIHFDETTLDYGTINQGENGVRYFKFSNNGKSPLIITDCKGSCGCTVPSCPKEPVMPGETKEIQVKYDTKKVGPFSKTVTVKSNASNGVIYLKIKGKINASTANDGFPSKSSQEGAPVE
jgi:hypothetical protein